jgi:hypothetical protein
MRSSHVLAAGFGVMLAAGVAVPARAEIVVNIDKNTQTMSVAVDGAQRYVWPVSTGRPGYDTPNGTFRPNRMDADHLSQEWDNAPMPHSIFFDMNGHAIHGFFDVKHLGSPVSHGCVRISPDHAATLFSLVSTEGMKATTVVVSGRTPAGRMPEVARRRAPPDVSARQPMQIMPDYAQQAPPQGYVVAPQPGYAPPAQQGYAQQDYAQAQVPPGYPPPPGYQAQTYYRQAQPYDGRQVYYRQPVQPPPPQQFFLFQGD